VFILIVGGGKVGTYLARALLKEDHEVVVIEKDPRKAQMMTNLLETDVAIVGDGCDPIVLSQAGLSRADVVVADTGDDEDNLVVCLITKKQSKARCIARVNNPKNKLIFESLDKEDPVIVISSTEVILNIIDEQVNTRDLASLVTLGKGELELVKLTIARDSPGESKRIGELALPRNSVIVAIERTGGELIIPNGDTVLHSGDGVIAMVQRGALPGVRSALVANGSAKA
jgi:trk system potassium uptake protein TrkA